jgi:rhodanese-related sulfurtransferase
MEDSGDSYLTVHVLLEEARSELERLSPVDALRAVEDGAMLIDIRSEMQRSRDGALPSGKWFPRNVLEWRLDPSSADRDPEAARRDITLIVICDEGYQSSLAAATLKRFGLRTTDVAGGFQAWRAAGLPVIADRR